PWQVYARPFDAKDTRPRLAIVVAGLGLDVKATAAAIADLPPAVSLAFSPYAHDLDALIAAARAKGHEVLLGLPLEPADYPDRDPGPDTLLTALTPQQNLARLRRIMGRGADYVGFLTVMGDRFTADSASIEPVLQALKARGLLYIDDAGPETSAAGRLARALGMAWAVTDRRLDTEPEATAVDQVLADLERQARAQGAALGLGRLYPVTVAQVSAWAKTLDAKGVALAPASAIVHRQMLPDQHK
ncbi:MAG: divergent polysaccharide deacetylase family protein, partial [Stellaceae bacterium]